MSKPPAPIPVTIITGFLGSGKTTFLNQILRSVEFKNTVVIVNEFGDIGLDHLLVESVNENTVLLSSGCLCCTIRDDLISTLENLLRSRDNNRMVAFDRVIIETTGLADPAPILHTIMGHKYLSLRYQLQGIVTLVDAVNGLATLKQFPESMKQVAVADRLIVSKCDIADAKIQLELVAYIKSLNPAAQILNTSESLVNIFNIIDCGLYNPDTKSPDVRRWLNEEALNEVLDSHEGHTHDTEPTLSQDANRHSDEIRAFCFTSSTPISLQAYSVFTELLRSVHGENLLRVKGILYLSDTPDQPLIVQGAQHVFHPPVFLERWPFQPKYTKLVFIARDLKPELIEKIWAALVGGVC